jgi:hypothetical protein
MCDMMNLLNLGISVEVHVSLWDKRCFFPSRQKIRKMVFIKVLLILDTESTEVEFSTSLFTKFNEFVNCICRESFVLPVGFTAAVGKYSMSLPPVISNIYPTSVRNVYQQN